MLYAYLLQLKNWVHWHYGTLMAFIGKKTICDLDLNIPGKEIEVEAAFYLFYFILELDLILEK